MLLNINFTLMARSPFRIVRLRRRAFYQTQYGRWLLLLVFLFLDNWQNAIRGRCIPVVVQFKYQSVCICVCRGCFIKSWFKLHSGYRIFHLLWFYLSWVFCFNVTNTDGYQWCSQKLFSISFFLTLNIIEPIALQVRSWCRPKYDNQWIINHKCLCSLWYYHCDYIYLSFFKVKLTWKIAFLSLSLSDEDKGLPHDAYYRTPFECNGRDIQKTGTGRGEIVSPVILPWYSFTSHEYWLLFFY